MQEKPESKFYEYVVEKTKKDIDKYLDFDRNIVNKILKGKNVALGSIQDLICLGWGKR